MAGPKISISAEPLESGKIIFLPMAPTTSLLKSRGRVFLRIKITNNDEKTLTVQNLTISFPGSSVPAQVKMINSTILEGKSLLWNFPNPSSDVLFDLPGPAVIKLAFKCQESTETTDFGFALTPHVSPVAGGAYFFPAQKADLSVGEFWSMNGCIHDVGKEGSQSFGYDMGVWGIDHDANAYSAFKKNTNGKANADFRVFRKPVRAMADGIVLESLNDCPDNPVPLSWKDEADLKAKLKAQQDKYWGAYINTNGGAGNHFYIQHGDEVMLYAHMQKGSLTAKFLPKKSVVKAGEILGLAGNSGNSSSPHTHIHAVQGTSPEQGPLRPIILKNAWAIDNDLIIKEPQKGFWSKMNKQGIPEGDSMAWDKQDVFLFPDATPPEWPEIVKLAIPEPNYQSVFKTMTDNGFRPVSFDAFTHQVYPPVGKTFFNVVFRPAAGLGYVAKHGLSDDDYQKAFKNWVTDENLRLASIESYFSFEHNRVAYAPLFVNSPGPERAAYHGKTDQEHQNLFADLTGNKGFVPVNISVVSVSGTRFFTALYEKRNVGNFEAKAKISVAQFQTLFETNANKMPALYPVYINSYLHGEEINIIAIWYEKIPPPYLEYHLNNDEFDALLKKERNSNLYLRGLTGYQRGLTYNFAALWNQ